jgi:uncharacterized protein (DUF1778 family)
MTTKTARLDFRLPEADKQLLEAAAVMSGQSITDFALSALRLFWSAAIVAAFFLRHRPAA